MNPKLTKIIYNTFRHAFYGMFMLCIIYSFAFADDSKSQKMSMEDIDVAIELNDLSVDVDITGKITDVRELL